MYTWIVRQSSAAKLTVFNGVQAYNVPLVGIWVSGVANPKHPLVWLACLKFFATKQLHDKVMQGSQAFLLLLYSLGKILYIVHLRSLLHQNLQKHTCLAIVNGCFGQRF